MSLTTALTQFVSRCDPSAVAPPTAYVEFRRLASILTAQLDASPSSHVLLLGQIGVGKSTELHRLCDEHEGKGQVFADAVLRMAQNQSYGLVKPPLDTCLDLNRVGWHDLLAFSLLWTAEALNLRDLESVKRLEEALRPPREVLVGSPFTTLEIPAPFGRKVLVGGPPAPTTTQRFRNEQDAIRKLIETGRAQIWDLSCAVAHEVERRTSKPLVLLLDGLEKMPDAAARRLFVEEGLWIKQLPTRAVVTGPLSMSFAPDFEDVEALFVSVQRLRAVPVVPGQAGFRFFLDMAKSRGAESIISEELLGQAVEWGGGLPRQFLQILSGAAMQAIADGLPRIEEECLWRGRLRAMDRWQYQLGPADYQELEKSDQERDAQARARLLRLAALIEYEKPDGSLRLGVNPLVHELMQRRDREAQRVAT